MSDKLDLKVHFFHLFGDVKIEIVRWLINLPKVRSSLTLPDIASRYSRTCFCFINLLIVLSILLIKV